MDNTLTWYKLFNASEVKNLPYIERSFELENYGTVNVRLCKATYFSLVINERFLPVNLNGRNPFISQDGKYGAVLDENNMIWLGVQL